MFLFPVGGGSKKFEDWGGVKKFYDWEGYRFGGFIFAWGGRGASAPHYMPCLGVIYIASAYFFRLFCTALGYHLYFFMYISLSQTSVYCPQQMPLFVSFCQYLVPDFASLMFCQHVIGQSLSQASFSNINIKSSRTIILLSWTFLLTNKIYCVYSQGLEKFLFLCTNPIYSQNKNNFQKEPHHSCYIFCPSTP